jgi:hypothetical protein
MSDDTHQCAFSNTDESPSPAHSETLAPDQQELSRILESFSLDPMGGTSLGKDGILRSLTADRVVIDAVPLPPRLIKAHLDRFLYSKEKEDVFRGVDGMQTPRTQWFDPPRSLLPKPLSEKHKEEARKMIEEYALLVKEGKVQGKGCCGPVVRSNYNLGLKE